LLRESARKFAQIRAVVTRFHALLRVRAFFGHKRTQILTTNMGWTLIMDKMDSKDGWDKRDEYDQCVTRVSGKEIMKQSQYEGCEGWDSKWRQWVVVRRIGLYRRGGCGHGFGSIFSSVRTSPDDMAPAGLTMQNGKLWRN